MKRYINLLPPAEQQLIKVAETSNAIRDFGIWLGISLVALSVLLFATKIFLNKQLERSAEQLATETETLLKLEATSARKEVEALNLDLENFKILDSRAEKWSRVLIELARRLPPDMTLDSITIDRSSLRVEVAGRADTRISVLRFRETLIASEYFANVNFPLGNLKRSRNVPWQYRFQIKPEKLK